MRQSDLGMIGVILDIHSMLEKLDKENIIEEFENLVEITEYLWMPLDYDLN